MRPVVLFFTLFFICFLVSKASGDETSHLPDGYSLELHLQSLDGPLLTGPLGLDGELLVVAVVPQLGRPGDSVLANIIWQLYTESGVPLPQFNKTRQILGLGNQEFCSFRIKAGELANGRYYIGLTHQLAQDPSSFYQASSVFEVHQPLAIKQIVVDESPRGKTHQRTFYEDQAPHIFVYYYLADDVYTALVQIDVVDSSGKVRASRTLFKDKDFQKKRERVGIKLPPGLFKAGEKALVQVSLSTPDDITVTATSEFEILAIDLGMNLPDRLRQGTVTEFQLFVPQTFNPPFKVDVQHIDGFIYKFGADSLTGKLFVTPVAEIGEHILLLSVVDASGNRASVDAKVTVEPGVTPSYQRQYRSNTTEQGGRIGSSTQR